MARSRKWHAELAWLGGEELSPNVLIEATDAEITGVTPEAAQGDAERLAGIVIPGLVSAHSHAFHRALRGQTHRRDGDFWAWRAPMYRLASRLTPDSYNILATAVFKEMLASGITTVGEFHYVHHQPDGTPYQDANEMGIALVEAARSSGIRMTLLDSAYLQSSVIGDPPLHEQSRFSDGSIEAWRDRAEDLVERVKHPTVRVGVAAHSVRAVSPPDLGVVSETARRLGVPLHVHLSEQETENEDCLSVHGMSPTHLLGSAGFLSSGATLIHGTHVDQDDIDLIASTGAYVCLCPSTEADLGDGIGPASEYARAGVPLCLGSDSNAIIDLLAEARMVEQHDRLRLRRRTVHSPATLLQAATHSGARALGWTETGQLAPGMLADFVVLDRTSLDLAGFDVTTGVDTVVMAASRTAVSRAFVGGREHPVEVGHEIDQLMRGFDES